MKILAYLGCCIVLLAMGGCQSNQTVEEELPSGLIKRYEMDAESGKKTGKYLLLKPDGTVLEESRYADDLLEGKRVLYNNKGEKDREEFYDSGELQGIYKGFYPSGELKFEGEYRDNEMSGLWTYYYESGEVKEKVHYEHNFEDGPFEEYYPDGTIKAKGNYLVGDNEDGLLFLYDESGAPKRVMECDSGICRTQWTPDSTEIDFDEVY